jgi:tetratricopeptide (TPR) repeat protein
VTDAADAAVRANTAPLARGDDAHALLQSWQQHDESVWALSPAPYVRAAEALRKAGEPLVAYDVIAEGLRHHPTSVRLRQLQGFTLAQSGDAERAIAVMESLASEPGQSPEQLEETLAGLARVYKEQALRRSGDEATRAAAQSRDAYLRAHQLSGGYYSGINAATMALRLGDGAAARALATIVGPIAESAVDSGPPDQRYWAAATVAESALILGDDERAIGWYRRALAYGDEPGAVASTRRNARLIVDALHASRAAVDNVLRVPRVASIVGSVRLAADGPFPAALEAELAATISRRLDDDDVRFGFSSGAAGTDIMLLEAVAQRGGRTHIVLPYSPEEFIPDRVARAGAGPWRERFDRAVANADELVVATDRRFTAGTALHEYAERLLFGLARVQTIALDTEIVPFVVLDDGANALEVDARLDSLRARGEMPVLIDVRSMRGARVESSTVIANPASDWAADTRILGILFADVVHSSSLTDDQQPLLVAHFLGRIGRLARESPNRPVWKNTWGDGLYMVFDDIGQAGRFSLELRDVISGTSWADYGLPAHLTMRIGLHAGPIFSYQDPITGYQNFTGRHTIRGARIEPVTLPGQVYASREYTALAAAAFADDFTCTPVGRVTLAKNAATTSLFVLEWASRPVSAPGQATMPPRVPATDEARAATTASR